MRKSIPLEFLSKYRTQFMGIAIILVMICHNSICVPYGFEQINSIFKSICQCGVDIFMILSGLGCYYSFHKTPKVVAFYKKRLIKIIIPYVLAVAAYAVVYVGYLGRATFATYLWSFSLISFFTDGIMIAWFVAAIIVLYLLVPIIYHLLQRKPMVVAVLCGLIVMVCIGISYLPLTKALTRINELFLCRIPSFLVGMIVGKALKSERKIEIQRWILFVLLFFTTSMIVLVLWLSPSNCWVIARALFLPFAFSAMLLLGNLLEKINKCGFIDKVLIFFGGITFELFLAHDKILATINEFLYLFDGNQTIITSCANVLAIILSIIGAWILHKVVNFRLPKHKKH